MGNAPRERNKRARPAGMVFAADMERHFAVQYVEPLVLILMNMQRGVVTNCTVPICRGGLEGFRFGRGAAYFTRPADFPANSSTHEGKIPRNSVPSAGRIRAALMPGESGSAFVTASLGSCMYIITRMRR